MALVVDFLDSFGHYNSAAWGAKKWAYLVNYGGPPAPFGADGYSDSPIQNATVARSTFEVSAYFSSGVPSYEVDMMFLWDTLNEQLKLRLTPDGSLLVRAPAASGGGIVGAPSSPGVMRFNAWHHVRMRFLIADSPTGEVQVWIDGALVLNLTGVDTKYATTNTVTQWRPGGGIWSHVASGVDFSGQPRVGVVFASGAGAKSEFTPTPAVANYLNIDETVPDIADYNSATLAAKTDLFKFANAIPATAVILACAVTALVKKTEATVCEIALVVHPPGGSDTVGATKQVPATDLFIQEIWTLNPFTGVAWTPAQANDTAFEAGYKSITVTP